MARRLGTAGYYVMLPNLYYRRVREFKIQESGREVMHEAYGLVKQRYGLRGHTVVN